MTRDEAIWNLIDVRDEENKHTYSKKEAENETRKQHVEALEMAIEALKQEPKTAHWRVDIDKSRRWDWRRFYCSECGSWQTYGETRFCPNCGAQMAQESEE